MAYNKSDLVNKIAQKSNLTKAQSEAAVNAFQDVLVEALQSGEGLRLTGVLSATRVKRAARTGRNPRTGETIEIPAGYGVKISAGSLLKKAVAND
ncbi:MAG: HU family DNA-binding protein [Bifidobacteriaceae bacterium]|nr:HU family DNA-binding protein [Bifidobacteriaceae bacterium]MEE0941090.1 HU family DNA-binding protein [Bifidobacteriaceae bacterium]